MLQRSYDVRFTFLLSLGMLVSFAAPNSYAQSNSKDGPLADGERASIMFDLNLKEIMENPLMKDFNIKDAMAAQGLPDNQEFDITKVNRIFGGVQIPTDPADLQPTPGQDLPMNFFMRFEFADSDSATQMVDSVKNQGSKEHTVNGKTYYSPDDAQAPPNLRLHKVNSSTVEMATERYALLKDRNVISKQLGNYWKQLPKDTAIKICIDLESNREVIDTMMAQAKLGAPPSAEPFLSLVDDLAGFTMGMDFDSDKLMTLRASGKDSEGTEKLQNAIDGLLGMGKFMGQSQLANMDEGSKKVFGEILKSLKANSEGNTVSVDVVKPEGFDDVVKGMMGQ